jgi:hypothetical protein
MYMRNPGEEPWHQEEEKTEKSDEVRFSSVTFLCSYLVFVVFKQGVQCSSKIRALISPVGPVFKNILTDGYKLSLNPGAIVKLF